MGLTTNDLVRSDNAFFVCTGITDDELQDGAGYTSGGASTQSVVLRAESGTIRSVNTTHALPKVREATRG